MYKHPKHTGGMHWTERTSLKRQIWRTPQSHTKQHWRRNTKAFLLTRKPTYRYWTYPTRTYHHQTEHFYIEKAQTEQPQNGPWIIYLLIYFIYNYTFYFIVYYHCYYYYYYYYYYYVFLVDYWKLLPPTNEENTIQKQVRKTSC